MSPDALRHRRHRARRRDGLAVLPVPTAYFRFVEALLLSGMPERDALDRSKVAAEAGAILEEWAQIWLEKKC